MKCGQADGRRDLRSRTPPDLTFMRCTKGKISSFWNACKQSVCDVANVCGKMKRQKAPSREQIYKYRLQGMALAFG